MNTPWIRRLVGPAGLLAAVWFVAPPSETRAIDPLPAAVAGKLIDADVAYLQKGLAKTPERATVNTLHGVAMLVALQAQAAADGPDGAKMAGLRDQALKVAEAIAKKDYAAAKAAAAKLSSPGTGDPKPVKLHEKAGVDANVIMGPFRNAPRGLNIEKDLRAQSNKTTDVQKAGEVGAHSALAAEYTSLMPPADAPDAKKQIWVTSSADMGKLGREVAAMAAAGDKADKAALQKKLKALDVTCTTCHNAFK